MLDGILSMISKHGTFELDFFKYLKDGWVFSDQSSCDEALSFNPHTGKGKGTDGAAHSRAICCIHFQKAHEK